MKNYVTNLKGSVTKSKGILLFGGVAIAALLGYSYYNTPEPQTNTSVVSQGAMNTPTIHGGSDALDPSYVEALSEADAKRAEAAKQNNASSMPTIVGAQTQNTAPLLLEPSANDPTPVAEVPEIDITQQPLVMATVPMTDTVPLVTAPPPPVAAQDTEKVNNMLTAMTRRTLPIAEVVQFGAVMPVTPVAEQSAPTVGATEQAAAASKVKLPLAGTILYAQLVGRANSDHPGPILAKVLQGEYTGATLIGTFQVAQNALTLTFDRMTVEKTRSGEEINEVVPIQAVAVDTKYIGTGLATSVDRHMFQKLAIAFTAGFAQGLGDAISDNGETTIDTGNGTITTGGDKLNTKEELLVAGGQAVSNAGSILQQEFGNRPTTVIVEAGTPLGVLFLQ